MQINPDIPGRLTRVAVGNVDAPHVSGNGKAIVYEEFDQGRWHVKRWRDGQTDNITDDPHGDLQAQVNDGGDVVVWSRYSSLPPTQPDGNFSVMRWRHGVTSTVADAPANQMDPAVSGNGRVLAWTYDDPQQPFHIQDLKHGKIDNITSGAVDSEPLVNRDGSRIFFRRKIHYDDGDMWMWDRKSGAVKQLTDTPWKENDPVINPKGTVMAWSTEQFGNDQLLRMDVDRGKTTVVAAENGVDETHAALSRDGSIIAYQRQPEKQNPQIYLAEKGHTVPLTMDGWNAFPSMSRNGRVISWVALEPDMKTVALYRFERSCG